MTETPPSAFFVAPSPNMSSSDLNINLFQKDLMSLKNNSWQKQSMEQEGAKMKKEATTRVNLQMSAMENEKENSEKVVGVQSDVIKIDRNDDNMVELRQGIQDYFDHVWTDESFENQNERLENIENKVLKLSIKDFNPDDGTNVTNILEELEANLKEQAIELDKARQLETKKSKSMLQKSLQNIMNDLEAQLLQQESMKTKVELIETFFEKQKKNFTKEEIQKEIQELLQEEDGEYDQLIEEFQQELEYLNQEKAKLVQQNEAKMSDIIQSSIIDINKEMMHLISEFIDAQEQIGDELHAKLNLLKTKLMVEQKEQKYVLRAEFDKDLKDIIDETFKQIQMRNECLKSITKLITADSTEKDPKKLSQEFNHDVQKYFDEQNEEENDTKLILDEVLEWQLNTTVLSEAPESGPMRYHVDLKKKSDMNKFSDRLQYNYLRFGISTSKKVIQQAEKDIEEFKRLTDLAKKDGLKVYMTKNFYERLNKSLIIIGNAVHPDSKEIMSLFQRTDSMYWTPYLLLFPPVYMSPVPLYCLLCQQTLLSHINWGNRNDTAGYKKYDFQKGYTSAMLSSILIALMSRAAFTRYMPYMSGGNLITANFLLNYVSGSLIGTMNLVLVRWKELKNGVQLQNQDGSKSYFDGIRSKAAGRKAIFQTAFSRLYLPQLPIVFPVYGRHAQEYFPKTQLNSLYIWTLFFYYIVALPVSFAIFKQRASIKKQKIEQNLQSQKEFSDIPEVLYFNKGL